MTMVWYFSLVVWLVWVLFSGVVSFLVSRRGKSKVGVAKIRFLESVGQEDSKNDHGVVLFASGVVSV